MTAEAFEFAVAAQYAAAFAKREAGDAAAMPTFAALVGSHADDVWPASIYGRLLNGATNRDYSASTRRLEQKKITSVE